MLAAAAVVSLDKMESTKFTDKLQNNARSMRKLLASVCIAIDSYITYKALAVWP